ncbi:hypothetical protein OUZ56_026539 [Daphnia magna]|uniref:Uncharacterized protein n=1 Tax=Daphnia magna TaxID=35525 RepID=A0ABQ9ZMU4_9CRUS|nr:hypothetical protein OUZ56_026539 [Daphnia magna]
MNRVPTARKKREVGFSIRRCSRSRPTSTQMRFSHLWRTCNVGCFTAHTHSSYGVWGQCFSWPVWLCSASSGAVEEEETLI